MKSTAISTSLFDSVKKTKHKVRLQVIFQTFTSTSLHDIIMILHGSTSWKKLKKFVQLAWALVWPLLLRQYVSRASSSSCSFSEAPWACTRCAHRDTGSRLGSRAAERRTSSLAPVGTRWHACGTRSPATDGYSATGGNCNCATVNMAKQSAKHVGKIENVEKIWQKMAKDGKNGKRSRNQNLAWDREFQRQNSCQSKSNCSLMLAFVKKRSKKTMPIDFDLILGAIFKRLWNRNVH